MQYQVTYLTVGQLNFTSFDTPLNNAYNSKLCLYQKAFEAIHKLEFTVDSYTRSVLAYLRFSFQQTN